MKKILDFPTRYDRAGGLMLKICLLCLICLGRGNISLQAQTVGNETAKVSAAKSQQGELLLRGTVKDKDGFPLPGVVIQVKGTTQGATTDVDGEYYIIVKGVAKPILIYSFIGMETQSVEFEEGMSRMDVTLKEAQQKLEEVVVNGIYRRNSESFTGSAATYTKETLKAVSNQNILQALSAIDPAFTIMDNISQGSNPNAALDISINGKTSIRGLEDTYGSNPDQPLFILDGFETTLARISDMSMDRIESITVLKDAASTAIYGAKAANGVVVVETRKPEPGKLRFSYNTTFRLHGPI